VLISQWQCGSSGTDHRASTREEGTQRHGSRETHARGLSYRIYLPVGWGELFSVITLPSFRSEAELLTFVVVIRVSAPGTRAEGWDRSTLGELYRLAADVPEAGIHFQGAVIYNREKDATSVTADWSRELCKEKPWFAGLVHEVYISHSIFRGTIGRG
jgi:hypothetical protein